MTDGGGFRMKEGKKEKEKRLGPLKSPSCVSYITFIQRDQTIFTAIEVWYRKETLWALLHMASVLQ